MSEQHNPPAFPVARPAPNCPEPGMSLRDYFAAHIAAGMSAFSGTSGVFYGPHDIAKRAYQVADAMLVARAALGKTESPND